MFKTFVVTLAAFVMIVESTICPWCRFGTDRDSERAVAMMNGQRIDGRVVTVGLYL